METAERIVEAYCRYVRHWFTIPDIKIKNNEIDLIAVDKDGGKAQIAIGVTVSGGFSRLKNSGDKSGEDSRSQLSAARTELGYFASRKFEPSEIVNELCSVYGFDRDMYRKILVVWGAEEDAVTAAQKRGIEVWLLPEMIQELENQYREDTGYYRDDTLRTLYLSVRTRSLQKKLEAKKEIKPVGLPVRPRGVTMEMWSSFISQLPKNLPGRRYRIEEISGLLDYDLRKEKSPVLHSAYWQGKHPHTDLWRQAGWKAKPVKDKDSGEIIAVDFTKLAQKKFI
jgi:hypothetical protein